MVIYYGSILLSVRGKPPSEGLWGLPGGAVEVGETVKEALVREILEETGVTVRPLKQIAVLDSITKDDRGQVAYHYILFEFLCEYVSGRVRSGSDAKDARWFPLTELSSINIMPTTLRFIKKILAQENYVLLNGKI